MKKLTVNVENKYDILIEKGLLDKAGEIIRPLTGAKKVVLITDTNVAPLYCHRVCAALEKAGFSVYPFVFEAGEASKRLSSIEEMVEFMTQKRLSRNDIAVALGGGVCGDMAGFAASVYMRGIDFVQIPTTLLAQIDSSVGGKTGVDLTMGKNLCGAFHQPLCVIIDPTALNTLSDKFFNDGMAEAIKTACIKSAGLFKRIDSENAKDIIEDIIFSCVDIKSGVVERDEKEKGERALLNFGHTFGHAIEKHYNFSTYSHGEAVAIGMVMMAHAGESLKITEKGTADAIMSTLKKYNLPYRDTAPLDSIFEAMKADKKNTGDAINLVMLKKIGESYILPANDGKLCEIKGVLNG